MLVSQLDQIKISRVAYISSLILLDKKHSRLNAHKAFQKHDVYVEES